MTAAEHVFDATEENFEAEVLQASLTTPILVDFWADWCEPCKTLGPLLEKLADEYNGAFRLARIDAERQQAVAGMFGIRSLPTVMLLKDGQMVDGFAGALPEGQLREFLARHVQPIEVDDVGDTASEPAEAVAESPAQAVARLQQAIATTPDDASLKLDLALALMRTGDTAAAQAELDALPANLGADERSKRLRGQLELAHAVDAAPSVQDLTTRIERDPGDWEARDLLGVRLLLGDAPSEGLEQFLAILRGDREWNEGRARQRLLAAFQVLDDAELVARYRRQMASVLF